MTEFVGNATFFPQIDSTASAQKETPKIAPKRFPFHLLKRRMSYFVFLTGATCFAPSAFINS